MTAPSDPYADVPIVQVGTISIPKIGLVHPMYEGVWLTVLDHGPGHWPGSAEPGQRGNTVVDGHRVTETPVVQNLPVSIEFGPGGPRVRLFVGDDKAIEALPPAPVEASRPTWLVPAIAGAGILVVILLFALRC